MDPNLLNYIKENLAKGVPQDQIRQTLLNSGWLPQDVDSAFSQLQSPQPTNLPPQQVIPSKPFFSLKFLLIGILAVILLASAVGGAYLFFNKKAEPITTEVKQEPDSTKEQPQQSLFDKAKNEIVGKEYTTCFAQFDEHLLPQLSPYQRTTFEKIDPYPDQDPNQIGAKKREIDTTYYFETNTSLRLSITEFIDHRAIESNINKLNETEKNRDPSKIESFNMKTIDRLDVYFVKEQGTTNTPPIHTIISHPPETNIRIAFQFIPTVDSSREEAIFSTWLKTVCP